jgi:hypothetical protein
MKKKLFAILAGLMFLSFCLLPAWAGDDGGNMVTISTSMASSYIGSSSGFQVYGQAGLMSNLNIAPKMFKGVYLNLWYFTDLKKHANDEIDFCLGWTGEVGPLTLDGGISYYDF